MAPVASPTVAATPVTGPTVDVTDPNPSDPIPGADDQDGNGSDPNDGILTKDPNNDVASSKQPEGSAPGPDLTIILGASVGGLVLLVAIAIFCICRKRRRGRMGKGSGKEDETTQWQKQKMAYESECAQLEEQTLKEIVSVPVTPAASGSGTSSNTPATLDSIAESPDDGDEVTVTSGFEISIAEKLKGRGAGNASLTTGEAEPAVRNLSTSFSEAANSTPASPKSVRSASQVSVSPPVSPRSQGDPPAAPAASRGSPRSTKHVVATPPLSPVSPMSQPQSDKEDLAAVKNDGAASVASSKPSLLMSLTMDEETVGAGTVATIGTEEPGFIKAKSNRNRPVSPLMPDSPVDRSLSPVNRPITPVNRPVSPSFSDIWSVDESLYIDDDKTHATAGGKSIDHPDDESGRLARKNYVRDTVASANARNLVNPQANRTQVTSAALLSRNNTRLTQSDTRLMMRQGTDKLSAYTAGARPKAGLFTRSQRPLSTYRQQQGVNDGIGYLEEREGRAAYSPSMLATNSVSSSSQSHTTNTASTAGNSGMWNNFLSELAKVEDQFFNPKMDTPAPPPPRASSKTSPRTSSKTGLSSPPPPPPPRDSSSDESGWDSDRAAAPRFSSRR